MNILEHYVPDPPVYASDSFTMKPEEHEVIFASTAGGAKNVTLPPYALARESYLRTKVPYFIRLVTGGNDLNILDGDSGSELTALGDLDATGDRIAIIPMCGAWFFVAHIA